MKKSFCLILICFLAANSNLFGAEEKGGGNASEPPALRLSLEKCIELAIRNNIEFLREEENLILDRLSLGLTKHNYGPLLSGSITADIDSEDTTGESMGLSVSQKIFTGGELSLSASTSGIQQQDGDGEDEYSSDINLSLVQPLLKGAGRMVYREDLLQAKRNLVYAQRSLTVFRQEFLIDVIERYYELIRRKKLIQNQEEKVRYSRFLLERSQAMEKAGKSTPIDTLRAEINLLAAQNSLIDAEELYKLNLDEFKLFLDLRMDQEIELIERKLTYEPIEVSLTESIKTALENRPELKTIREQLEDARRGLALARNDLKSELDLVANIGYITDSAEKFSGQTFGEADWSVQLQYEIPLDKFSERVDYRNKLINYIQQVRSTRRQEDRIILDVRSVVRDLERAKVVIEIQKRNIEAATKRLKRADIDFDRGLIKNRDVVEAQNELLSAKNSYDEAVVNYIIAKLQLQKEIGILDFSKWRELIK